MLLLPMPKKKSVKTKSGKRSAQLAETTFKQLQQAILSGELKPGERVREQRLAREWGIGRTPLREAVRRAAELGYLILRPNEAPRVRKLSAQDILQIYSLREVLECFALRAAWPKLNGANLQRLRELAKRAESATNAKQKIELQLAFDAALHQLWIKGDGNPWLACSLDRLLIYRPNLVEILMSHRALAERAFEEHCALLAAIEGKNLKSAVWLLTNHIRKSAKVLSALLDSMGTFRASPSAD
jgi:DNA-binding GntR family transcriptional regulator